MPAFVDVVPTDAHVTERLVRTLDTCAGVVAPATFTFAQLVRALHSRFLPSLRVAPAPLERILLARSLRDARAARENAPAEHTGSIDALAHALDLLRRNALGPDDLTRAMEEVPPGDDAACARLTVLADVLRDADTALAARGWISGAALEARLAVALGEAPPDTALPPPFGPGPCVLRVHDLHEVDTARVQLLIALARALGTVGGRLELQVTSEPRRERTPIVLDRALRAIEDEEDLPLELHFALRDREAPMPREGLLDLLTALGVGGRAIGTGVALAEAHGPDEEARWIAAQIEAWLRAGLGPDEIAVVVRDPLPEVIAPLARALDEARIPWHDGCGAPLLAAPIARAALALPRMLARGAPREELLHAHAVLVGHAPRAQTVAPHQLAQALRTLGITALLGDDVDTRLGDAARRNVAERLVREARAWRDTLAPLAAPATVSTHAARLTAYLDALGGAERHLAESRAILASAGHDPGAQSIARAIARDEAALRAVLELLAELPAHVAGAGRDDEILTAAEFADLLADVAAVRALRLPNERGGGVLVAPAKAVIGRSFRALAVAGLNDGGFPAHARDETMLGEIERRAVLRTSGKLLARAGGREEETLVFLSVIACATESLALSGCRHDVGGRALPASPFMVDARRAVGTDPVHIAHDPLARSALVPPRGAERATRAWVQESAEPPALLAHAIRSARARAAIERERRDFFAGRLTEPGRYSGRLDHDARAVATLDLRAYGSARRPVDVTTLERAARCGFKTFANEILGLRALEEPAVTLDAKERGHLLHALVEAGQHALRATRGRTESEQWAAITAAIDAAGERFVAREAHADEHLLRADFLTIRRQVEVWLRKRMNAQDRWEMLETEVAFGPEKKWPALQIPVTGEAPIVIKGRIDGVERMDDEVRVVEFKSGRGDGFRKRLREGALDTQFQLVVYTAALSQAAGHGAIQTHGPVDGVYVGFRDQTEHGLREVLGRARRGEDAPAMDVDTVVAEGARGEGQLGEAVRKAIVPLRLGVFAPRPRDCGFCDAASLCRVENNERGSDE